jgi:hypothetical protein
MATFLDLPSELVEYVYSYLAQPDLNIACRLNKGLHALAIPFLYRNVDLYIRARKKIPRIDWFCMNIVKDQRLAVRVESIRLGPAPDDDFKLGSYQPHETSVKYLHTLRSALGTPGPAF